MIPMPTDRVSGASTCVGRAMMAPHGSPLVMPNNRNMANTASTRDATAIVAAKASSLYGHDLDLDSGAEWQARGLNRCPGRIWCLEIARVNRVHRAEILHIREVDSGLHHAVEGFPRRFQHG